MTPQPNWIIRDISGTSVAKAIGDWEGKTFDIIVDPDLGRPELSKPEYLIEGDGLLYHLSGVARSKPPQPLNSYTFETAEVKELHRRNPPALKQAA